MLNAHFESEQGLKEAARERGVISESLALAKYLAAVHTAREVGKQAGVPVEEAPYGNPHYAAHERGVGNFSYGENRRVRIPDLLEMGVYVEAYCMRAEAFSPILVNFGDIRIGASGDSSLVELVRSSVESAEPLNDEQVRYVICECINRYMVGNIRVGLGPCEPGFMMALAPAVADWLKK